jgi:hypothetical protein
MSSVIAKGSMRLSRDRNARAPRNSPEWKFTERSGRLMSTVSVVLFR